MKEIWVDCREENLENMAVKYGATGVRGQSKKSLRTLPENSLERVEIKSQKDIDALKNKLSSLSYLIAKLSDWKVIPVENLIALTQRHDIKILVETNDTEVAESVAYALESGVDGFLVSDPKKVGEFCSLYQPRMELNLVDAEVTEVKKAEIGKRVCVDTIASFEEREGILVGFRPYFMVLADAERYENPYVNVRDWRVNAGAARLYTQVFSEDGFSPKLLDDLKAKDEICEEILAVNHEGKTRKAYAAVLKKERRPMKFIKAKYGNKTGTICSQDAETVRIVSPDGSIPVSNIRPGDMVKAYISEPLATHFGRVVKEYIVEI